MTSIQPRFTSGPRTYEAAEVLVGGQVVEARAGGVDNPAAGLAADASKKVVGVALTDASPTGGAARGTVNGVLDTTLSAKEFAAQSDGWVPVQYAAACAFGAKVCSAGAGKVRPWIAADGADAIIGHCAEDGGVAQNAYGLTRINL